MPWGNQRLTAYLGEVMNHRLEWDSCELMLASQPQDAIPVLIDQATVINSPDQLQPAVLAEAARQTARRCIANPACHDHSYYFIVSFIEDHLRHARYLRDERETPTYEFSSAAL